MSLFRRRPQFAPRVIIASRIFSPEPAAASYRLAALADALAASGAVVTVVTSTVPPSIRAIGPNPRGVRVHRFPVLRDRSGYVRGYLQYLSFDIPLAVRLLLAPRPNLVVSEPPPTTALVVRIVCGLRRIPYAYYAADVWSDASEGAGAPDLVVRLVRAAERAVIQRAELVLSVSGGVTERLEPWKHDGVVTVGHGIDTDTFCPVGPAEGIGRPYFLYAGTASEVHGARIFLDALRLINQGGPRAGLVFIGQGTDVGEFERAAEALTDGSVKVMARQSAADTAAWIRGAVATLASVRPGMGYDYAVPTKSYASMACGVPVILSGPSPLAAVVPAQGLGWACAYDDRQIAACMMDALRTPRNASASREIVAWARRNVSARHVADRAARAVLDAAGDAGD